MNNLPPGTLLIIGAWLLPLLRRPWREIWLVALPLLSLAHLLATQPDGTVLTCSWFELTLTPIRVDRLSLVWGGIFHLAAALAALYAVTDRDDVRDVAALTYAGSAIAAVFAGDLLTLFVFWELTAITSVFLVWIGKSPRAYAAGFRYLLVQVASGVLLMAGVMFHYQQTGSLAFGELDQIGVFDLQQGWGPRLILLSMGIKAAFPFLHMWLPDAYPESSPAGTVFLSIFTTKLAIYALARGFAGTEALIWIGAMMTVFPLVYTILVNDLRRVLAYSLNNQLGYMVVGIGLGTPLAINGTAAHAVSHILYKSLLFMSMGAVLRQAGTVQASELGGLRRCMPWTMAACCVGALGMSTPLFCGFVSKSLIFTAVAEEHLFWVWLILVATSAVVFVQAGVHLVLRTFGGSGPHEACEEAPVPMRLAMLLTAALCILVGVLPQTFYRLLPGPVEYQPYTLPHVITQLQLLVFATVAYLGLWHWGIYPRLHPACYLDADWLYRRPLPRLVHRGRRQLHRGAVRAEFLRRQALSYLTEFLRNQVSEVGRHGAARPTGWMALWAGILLATCLLLYYV